MCVNIGTTLSLAKYPLAYACLTFPLADLHPTFHSPFATIGRHCTLHLKTVDITLKRCPAVLETGLIIV